MINQLPHFCFIIYIDDSPVVSQTTRKEEQLVRLKAQGLAPHWVPGPDTVLPLLQPVGKSVGTYVTANAWISSKLFTLTWITRAITRQLGCLVHVLVSSLALPRAPSQQAEQPHFTDLCGWKLSHMQSPFAGEKCKSGVSRCKFHWNQHCALDTQHLWQLQLRSIEVLIPTVFVKLTVSLHQPWERFQLEYLPDSKRENWDCDSSV